MRRLLLTLTASFLAASSVPAAAQAAWVWPVSGEVITPYRNGTDPYANGQHRGIDIAAPVGEPVVAASGGDVRFAGTAGSSGLTISIRTGDGYDTSYLHLSSVAVRAGAHVSAGDRIGAVGTSGVRSASAPHLHFGIRDAGTRHDYHDPLAFLPPAPAPRPPASAPTPKPDLAPPAPAPQPAPPTAAPVAVPRPAPVRHRPRVPAPHPRTTPAPDPRTTPAPDPRTPPAPDPRTTPAPHPRPVPAPHDTRTLHPRLAPALHGRPAPAADNLPVRASHGRPAPALHRRPMPQAARDGAPARRSAPHGALAPSVLREPRAHPAPEPGPGGPDIGWAAACAGLLAAAALLGLKGDRRRRSQPSSRARGVSAEALRGLLRNRRAAARG